MGIKLLSNATALGVDRRFVRWPTSASLAELPNGLIAQLNSRLCFRQHSDPALAKERAIPHTTRNPPLFDDCEQHVINLLHQGSFFGESIVKSPEAGP
jgi:hypothetical protein